MTVSETILFAILTMVGVVVAGAFPVLVYVRGYRLWEEVPRDVYQRFPQRIGRLRPQHLWFAVVACRLLCDLLAWRHFSGSATVLKQLSGILIILVFLWQMVWAIRVLRQRLELDARLVRFAKFVLVCVSLLLALVFAGGWAEFVK